MPYIPEDQRDTRYYIWNERFRCKMRYADTISLEDLRRFGIPTSGDRARDRDMMDSRVDRYLSINEMVEYFRQGIEIGVCADKDTKKIYEYISDHLEAMKEEVRRSFSTAHLPVDDLILMDQFANSVYENAKYHFTREDADSLIAQCMNNIVSFTPENILGVEKAAPVAVAEENEEDKLPKRTGLAQYFQQVARSNRNFYGH